MKAGKRIVAAAFAGTLCLATSMGLSADQSWSPVIMKPLMRQVSTSDQTSCELFPQFSDGRCKLTLTIADQLSDATSRSSAEEPRQPINLCSPRGPQPPQWRIFYRGSVF